MNSSFAFFSFSCCSPSSPEGKTQRTRGLKKSPEFLGPTETAEGTLATRSPVPHLGTGHARPLQVSPESVARLAGPLTLLQREGGRTGRRHDLFVLGSKARHQTRQHLDTEDLRLLAHWARINWATQSLDCRVSALSLALILHGTLAGVSFRSLNHWHSAYLPQSLTHSRTGHWGCSTATKTAAAARAKDQVLILS